MPGSDHHPKAGGWQPRHPDPALTDPDRPGLRAHRHPQNRLHTWVFAQERVWVDYWGNEIEIETMSDDYLANVVTFAQRQAERIRDAVALDLLSDQLARLLAGVHPSYRVLHDVCAAYEFTPDAWLERTPLLQALNRRLEDRPK